MPDDIVGPGSTPRHYRPRRRRGQSTVELALVLPLLLLAIFGLLDLARAMNVQVVVSNAAREGARAGISSYATDAEIEAAAQSVTGLAFDSTVVITPLGSRAPGDTVTVTVRAPFSPATPVVGSMVPGGTIWLQGRSARKVE